MESSAFPLPSFFESILTIPNPDPVCGEAAPDVGGPAPAGGTDPV